MTDGQMPVKILPLRPLIVIVLYPQVSHDSGSVTIDPRKAERAMLIKNCAGDWGTIRALWYDPEKGENSEGDWGIIMALWYDPEKGRNSEGDWDFIRALWYYPEKGRNSGGDWDFIRVLWYYPEKGENSEGDWGTIRALWRYGTSQRVNISSKGSYLIGLKPFFAKKFWNFQAG